MVDCFYFRNCDPKVIFKYNGICMIFYDKNLLPQEKQSKKYVEFSRSTFMFLLENNYILKEIEDCDDAEMP